MHLLTVVGARPQFIKLSAITQEIDSYNASASKKIKHTVIHTGQHYDFSMSDSFFESLGMPEPTYNLGIANLSHGALTGRMLENIESIIQKEQPDWTIVIGDTDSTLAAALAASKLNIPVAHIEAGLRSYNREMPEEINRILTDHCSNLLFTPTARATETLTSEGIQTDTIVEVGDVMIDVLKRNSHHPFNLPTFDIKKSDYAVATVHRCASVDNKESLQNIIDGLLAVTEHMPVLWPIHPRTKKSLETFNLSWNSDQLIIIPPVSYPEMIQLLINSKIVLTDSGGLQKEAALCGSPVVILRDETEWVELINERYAILAGTSPQNILKAFTSLINSKQENLPTCYGEGKAGQAIISALLEKNIRDQQPSL